MEHWTSVVSSVTILPLLTSYIYLLGSPAGERCRGVQPPGLLAAPVVLLVTSSSLRVEGEGVNQGARVPGTQTRASQQEQREQRQ